MTTFLVLAVIVVVALHLRWTYRRHYGAIPSATLLRDLGLAAAFLYACIEGSSFWLDYAWWKELGQLPTFWQFLRIRWLPQTAAAFAAALILCLAFALARRRCAAPAARTRFFGGVGYLIAILLGAFLSLNIIDPWTIALYLGAHDTGIYQDPLFHKDLTFYLFRLPLYQMIFDWLAALAIAALALAAATALLAASSDRWSDLRARINAGVEGRGYAPPIPVLRSTRISLAGLVRAGAILLLVLYAASQFFERYALLFSPHRFLTGADFVDVRFGLPLLWAQIAGALALALLIAAARRGHGAPLPSRGASRGNVQWIPDSAPHWLPPAAIAAFLLLAIGPGLLQALVRAVYVSPNELTLERPYIADHIRATRMAFNIEQTAREEAFTPRAIDSIDLTQYPDTANNIRLWDAEPFQDNVTQLQALRPYYAFPNVDVDRYPINGQMRQVMLAPRALDTGMLPQSAQTWVNLNLQFTHGYGAVASLVNSATSEGQPDLILKNAPPAGPAPDFQITRPGLYFGESEAGPVFVDTNQPEFDYPKGDDDAYTTYTGTAGIPLASPFLRFAAAVQQDDTNVLLTRYFTPKTRLLLHRQITDRVQTLAPFLSLDPDPYLVIDARGRLFWMLDAYTTSDQHPYAQPVAFGDGSINYIRNSVKITVDAYNGDARMYVFDDRDPILAAYRRVFPNLFLPRAAMPADLLAHIRYPQALFEAQAETYRLYHMQDPQVFYNKEDQWDIAKQVVTQEETRPTAPYYMMLRLPGESQSEFALLLPFTSHSRDNLISWLAARCDPDHYGQIIFYRLPKEQLVYGPLQIQSRVDQDRNISKDLSLWNQQGSRVIRGTTLVLPVDGTFLYVEPIYIQATQAKMPELKKVVLAMGNRLVYSDDLPSAIRELAQPEAGGGAATTSSAPPPPGPVLPLALSRAALQSVENHLTRYRELTAQGQFAQAGAELQAAEDEIRQALSAH